MKARDELGKGCFLGYQVCAPMELPYTAPTELRVMRRDEPRLFFPVGGLQCTGNTAAADVAMQKPCMSFFVLAHFICITCHEATDRIYFSMVW